MPGGCAATARTRSRSPRCSVCRSATSASATPAAPRAPPCCGSSCRSCGVLTDLLHCRAPDALPDGPFRGLLPDRADDLVAVDAASAALEAVHHRRELHLLRGRELAFLPAAGRDHARQPAVRGP